MSKQLEEKIEKLEQEIAAVKKREQSQKAKLHKRIKISLIIAMLTFSAYGIAVISQLHVFSPGDPISAQEINENFEYLESLIGSGGGGGGITVQTISTNGTYTPVASDNNSLIVVTAIVDVTLPSVSSVNNGFLIRFKQTGNGQVLVTPTTGDTIDGSDKLLYISNYGEVGIVTFISDGTEWNILSTVGNTQRIATSEIYTGCSDGEGTGASNCYVDSNVPSYWYIRPAGGYLYYRDTMYSPFLLERKTDYKYLINDQNNLFTDTHVPNSSMADAISNNMNFNSTLGKYTIDFNTTMGLTGSVITNSSDLIHSNSSDSGYLNTIFNASNGGNYHCKQLGGTWRIPELSETAPSLTGGISPPSGQMWTATPDSGTSDAFYRTDGTTNDSTATGSARMICIRD